MSKPKLPSLGVVSGHAHALLGRGVELVEEVRIHPCTCRDDEEARARFAFEIEIFDAAKRDAAGCGMKSGAGCGRDIHGQAEVVGQCVGRSQGQDRQGRAGVRQHLDHVVDGAVSATSKDRVPTGKNGLPRLLLRVSRGVREDELGLNACAAEQRQHGFQLRLASHAAAAGVRVIE